MELDQIIKEIQDKEEEFRKSVGLLGDEINLGDVIKALKNATAFPINSNPSKLRVGYDMYEIVVSEKEIYLRTYSNLIHKHFEGEGISSIYEELRKNYKEAQKREFHLRKELLKTVQ
ncbi:MAG: hypothetical protein AABX48_02455 [Nanoarchaeota archaeon]